MVSLGRRYAHVPLGLVSVLLLVAAIAWLLDRHVEGLWGPTLRLAAPVPAVVTIAAVATPADAAPVSTPAVPESDPPVVPDASAPPPPLPVTVAAAPPAAEPVERYALESGPFGSADAADRIEDQLNHLGYATVRFRKQELRLLYIVTVAGFASVREARRAAADLGRGTVVEGEASVELQVERFLAFGEAIAAARPMRARGYDVRVDEDRSPTVIYHVRYGQFPSRAAAEARAEELALFGLATRVVRIK